MRRLSGLKLLEEREGGGKSAQKGDRVVCNIRILLNRGEDVPLNEIQATHLPAQMARVDHGSTFIDHTILLGRRQVIAGVKHALSGMKAGGYRKVRGSPHLAYRHTDIPDLIPPGCVLICEIWLRAVSRA